MRRARTCALLATAAALVWAPTAAAVVEEDNRIARSPVDGAPIVYKLFLPDSASAASPVPAVLMTHGWSGSRARGYSGFVRDLVDAGYAVLTWDQRGFGESGGEVQVDDPDYEGRDVLALLDVLGADPRIAKESPGDPRVGMAGGSYAGGVQFLAAALDPERRVDAIAPEIAWNDLLESLIPEGVLKTGWGALLYGAGQTALTAGLSTSNPAGPQTGAYDPMIHRALAEGAATGRFSPEVERWFARKGPDFLLADIEAPTFIVQATTDALFPPQQAVDNYLGIERGAPGTPLKMAWYCGGHGSCAPFIGDQTNLARREIVRWFDRWVREDDSVDTGPRFEFLDDDGTWHGAAGYPVPGTVERSGSGSGVVVANGEPVASGILQGSSGRTTLKVPIAAGTGTAIGAPRIRMSVRGAGSAADELLRVPLFFQLVNEADGEVIGNQVTPRVVAVDGETREYELEIEPIAYAIDADDRIALEVATTAAGYEPYRGAAALAIERLDVSIPVLP